MKRTTVEEFDEVGKLRKRTVMEEELYLVPTYPALPLYPWPAPPAIIPYDPMPIPLQPWNDAPCRLIMSDITGITPRPQLTASGSCTFQVS